jgi:predicted MFS family arabinose efflux permease
MTVFSQPPPDRLPWSFVGALSLAQLVSWGSLIYAFTLFVEPMGRDLGWSKAELSAAYSLGLVASGLGAAVAGRLIDAGHGRFVMAGGSLLAAILLVLWSRVASYPAFLAIWMGLGLAMSATLYEPGFAVLTLRLGALSRRGITVMTLVGGFASTVFVPLTHLLIETFGWRDALLWLAGFNGFGCALVHVSAITGPKPRQGAGHPDVPSPGARRVLGRPAFWGFVAVAVLHSALLSGFIVHLVPVLVERGFSLDRAVLAFALFGPAQVAARLLIAASERWLDLRAIGLVTMTLLTAAFGLLPFVPPGSWLIALFCVLLGAANGMMTILRALLPAELFGRADYGTIQGLIATPATFARAAGPLALAALWSWTGATGPVLGLGVAIAAACALAYVLTIARAKTDARADGM